MGVPRSDKLIKRLLDEKKERLKELTCINQTTAIIKEGKTVEETLRRIAFILPKAWQYPDHTAARLRYGEYVFTSPVFRETEWKQSQDFKTIDNVKGTIDIYYLQKYPDIAEGPFLKEERDLINNLAIIISNYLNTIAAKKTVRRLAENEFIHTEITEFQEGEKINSRKLLQKFLNKQNASHDIVYDLMPYRVKEILLVSTLYDAFAIEKEGRFSEHILGEYHQLNLTYMPRVTGVSTFDEAVEQLSIKNFDLVIIMIGNDKTLPDRISRMVKSDYSYIPIYGLLNNNLEIEDIKIKYEHLKYIDKLFSWHGDPRIFFAMIKLLEDSVNVENDTQVGLVKVILLVEDSEIYYSCYLPLLYNSVLEQTRRLIEDVSTDELFKVLRLRARPKIILATNYEEAQEIINRFGDNLLCIITDVKFHHNGVLDENAGLSLITEVREKYHGIPVVIQSADTQHSRMAFELKSIFINKNSDTLTQDIKSFISHYLGFGNFEYRDTGGRKIAEAKSLKEFEDQIETIPLESLIYHAKRNHFSLWLMARGEIKIAKMIHPVKISDFKSPQEFRNYLQYVIRKYRNETNSGKLVNFEVSALLDETNIVSLGSGALGGKGRGLTFINTLIYNLNFSDLIPGINIRTPRTSIIGTDEFDFFLERNNLFHVIHDSLTYPEIRKLFLEGELSYHLEKKLKSLISVLKGPLAIRSSSLLEDSTTHPFSGVFDTCFLPNNNEDQKIRLKQLTDAIKLVYASIYSDESKSYFNAIHFRLEDEKMAIVIQEVVGETYGTYFYPHISGTAQSYNFYPVAHMEPEDGFAIAALGLGHYVVQGEQSHRFSPKYPDSEINIPESLVRNTQVEFIAIDLSKKNFDLLKEGTDANLIRLSISEAEKHDTIRHLASVYNIENDRLESGLAGKGPRVLNFADILKYEYIPLAKTLEFILDIGQEAMGSPIEIEYAVNLKYSDTSCPSFYLLQIKPLLAQTGDFKFDINSCPKENIIILSQKSMGNGRVDDICDLVFIKPESFDKLRTREIAGEIDHINKQLKGDHKRYILIGPGRWGSRDPLIGIPVNWSQISSAKIIVETGLENYPLDASLGSHFFHNITSMNVGYFSIPYETSNEYINWESLRIQETVSETEFLKHVRFARPLIIIMDGKRRISAIYQQ